MPNRKQQCEEPLELTPEARKAFADRQAKLIRNEKWPMLGWYHDQDFCQAYNTAVQLADENARLQKRIEELETAGRGRRHGRRDDDCSAAQAPRPRQ